MTARDFCYWLQGYFEIAEAPDITVTGMSGKQMELVRRHLSMVFAHDIDPSAGGPEVQAKLDSLHRPPGVRC